MYVYMYIYIYIYICVYMYMYTCAYLNICMYLCVYEYSQQACVYICTRTHTCNTHSIRMHALTNICTQAAKPLHVLEGQTDDVLSVAISHDQKLIASSSSDDTIKIWSKDTGACLYTPTNPDVNHEHSLSFSQDDTKLVSSCSDDTIKV